MTTFTFKVDGEMVEVAGDLGHVDGFDQGHWRVLASDRCLRRHRYYESGEDEAAFHFHVRLVGNP